MTTAWEGIGRRLRTLLEAGAVGDLGDGRLLERFLAGEGERAEAAFASLVERHGPMVWRACRSILADPNDADDAFQATFLVLARRSRSLWVRDSLGPWLLQVARRTSLRARAQARERGLREHAAAGERPPLVEPRPLDDLAAIHEEIARLPGRYREVVVLCLLEGLADEHAAARLGLPLGTVHSRLARGRERLRRGLTRRGLAPAAALAALGSPVEAASAVVPPGLVAAAVRAAAPLAEAGARSAVMASALSLIEGVAPMSWIAQGKAVAAATALLGGVALAAAVGPTDDGLDPNARAGAGRAAQVGGEKPREADEAEPPPDPPDPPRQDAAADARTDPPFAAEPLAPGLDDAEALEARRREPSSPVVRITVEGPATAVGFGVIVRSRDDESIVLTAAGLLAPAGGPGRADSDEAPRRIAVTLAAGLHMVYPEPAPAEFTLAGEVVACDPARNVGLVRIRPGRALPSTAVVWKGWPIQADATLTAYKLDEGGHLDARALRVLDARVRGVVDGVVYSAIECEQGPEPGALGMPLDLGLVEKGRPRFLIAGICNYSYTPTPGGAGTGEPTTLFASPEMIHHVLEAHGYPAEPERTAPSPRPAHPRLPAEGHVPATSPSAPFRRLVDEDGEPSRDTSRIDAIERRVGAMDRKLDEVLERLRRASPPDEAP